ncbi:hypothetical protein HLV31_38260 [Pseudomonas aeruginosa]|nr:hypothetical protein [Pseudomonas aeruginosa]
MSINEYDWSNAKLTRACDFLEAFCKFGCRARLESMGEILVVFKSLRIAREKQIVQFSQSRETGLQIPLS